MASITDLAAAGSVAATDNLVINQSGTDRKVTADKFALLGAANNGKVILGRADLTIAAGAITPTRTFHRVDTEGAAATDDLATISGGADGQLLILMSVANTRDVTVKHATGNIHLDGMADFTFSGTRDKLMLICVGDTEWHEIGRGNNV